MTTQPLTNVEGQPDGSSPGDPGSPSQATSGSSFIDRGVSTLALFSLPLVIGGVLISSWLAQAATGGAAPRRRAKRAAPKRSAKRVGAKRTTAKRVGAKRTAKRVGAKRTAKRRTVRRTTAKRAPAKRRTVKRTTAKRAPAKRRTVKRAAPTTTA